MTLFFFSLLFVILLVLVLIRYKNRLKDPLGDLNIKNKETKERN